MNCPFLIQFGLCDHVKVTYYLWCSSVVARFSLCCLSSQLMLVCPDIHDRCICSSVYNH